MSAADRPAKPLPDVTDPWYGPYWEGTRAGQLRFQHCDDCGYIRWPPGPLCPECLSGRAGWRPVRPTGRIYSFGVYEHCYNEAFRADLPYNVALVCLDDGPRLMTNIVGIANDEIGIDMPVTAVFEPVTDQVTLVKFRPQA